MIMEQLYPGKEDYVNHFNYVLPAFKDKRYITVDGKPLFVVFDPLSMPDMKEFIDLWRKLASQNGLLGIHFVGLRYGRKSSMQQLLDMGFDAINDRSMWEAEAQAVGSKTRRRLISLFSWKMGIALSKYDYKDIIRYIGFEDNYLENNYPTILPGYDRTARAGKRAIIYHNATPQLFREHVRNTLSYVQNRRSTKIYKEIQNILFSLIPEKWESLYLYASVIKGRGEMYFYYFPKKTILKQNR